jgi:hypothetical protein
VNTPDVDCYLHAPAVFTFTRARSAISSDRAGSAK